SRRRSDQRTRLRRREGPSFRGRSTHRSRCRRTRARTRRDLRARGLRTVHDRRVPPRRREAAHGGDELMPKLRLHLTFPEGLIQDPIIWRLGRQYDIITNIRRANVEESVGWVILEVEGTEEALDQGVGWMREMGVQVDRLSGDVVES